MQELSPDAHVLAKKQVFAVAEESHLSL